MKKKRKKTRNLLILLAVLVVACGGYYGLARYNAALEAAESAAAESEEEAGPSLLGLSGTINHISYQVDGETISLVLQDEQWYREDDESFPLDQTTVTTLVSTLSDAEQEQEIPDAASSLADYGLEEPSAQVTVGDDTGASVVLLVGDENTAAGGCYAMLQDSGQVYLTTSSLVDAFTDGWLDLIQVDEGPEIASENVQNVTVAQGDTSRYLQYESAGWPEYDYTESANLFLQKADGGFMPVDSSAQSSILSEISGISFDAVEVYAATEEDRAAAGLSSPSAVITIHYTKEETVTIKADEEGEEDTEETVETDAQFVLYVGNHNEENGTYSVAYEGGNNILSMLDSDLEMLLNLNERTLANLSPSNIADTSVDSIEVSYGGETQTLSIERVEVPVETEEETEAGDSETEADTSEATSEESEEVETETQVTYYLDGAEISSDDFRTYSDALEIAGARVLEEGEALPVENAELTVVFHRNVEAYPTVTISYIPYNENYYQVSVNGEEPSLVVNIRDVQNVIAIFQDGVEAAETEAAE